ncbi:hypothetical protein [Marinomonas phage CPP1m]|uniref:Uncharacterized protein n=2 Tax=Murciavirus CPP1m TaxID=2733327 RepID=A0A1W5SC22_9CAUD|nr:hypothetical protein HOR72_gp01 [Marinomonas phage CPP1m]ARB11220.1 hypothetical protein [Marinomonas phage CPP1m]ARB11270.1 hypothetical protein [Marinomonas phage CPG1g]
MQVLILTNTSNTYKTAASNKEHQGCTSRARSLQGSMKEDKGIYQDKNI